MDLFDLPDYLRVLLGALVAFLVVFSLVPPVRRLAPRIGGVDEGGDRPRVHLTPTPRIGGLAIVFGLLSAALFLERGVPYQGVLLGTLAVAAVGLLDDLLRLPALAKLIGTTGAALVPVLAFGLSIERVTVPLLGSLDLGSWGAVLTVLWLVLVANLLNLVDGLDGLASGLVVIAASTLAVLALSFARFDAALLAAAAAAAALAFLYYNRHPASIFMGDTGSLSLGFFLAALAVDGALKTTAAIALLGPLLALAVPLLDGFLVVLKRLLERRPPWRADQHHSYHRLLARGLSQRVVVRHLHAWAFLFAAYAVLVRFLPPKPHGQWDLENTVLASLGAFVLVAASLYAAYLLGLVRLAWRRRRADVTNVTDVAAVD